MKRVVFSLVLICILKTPLMAAMTTFLTIEPGVSYPSSPYTVHLNGGYDEWQAYGIVGDFQTFCVEEDKFYRPNRTYYATIDDIVMYGGGGGALNDTTKKIYAAFLNGALDETFSNDIQRTIWDSEAGLVVSLLDGLVENDYVGYEQVMVLNLWRNYSGGVYSGDAQSQLVKISPVPAPGAMLLGSIGVGLVSWLRRRRTI